MSQIRCPSCGLESTLPADFLGKKVRCKNCSQPFTATPVGAVTAEVVEPRAVTAEVVGKAGGRSTALAAGRATATTGAAAGATSPVVDVVALLKEEPAPLGPGVVSWVLATLLLLGPVGAAGAFVAVKWLLRPAPVPTEICGVVEVGSKGVKLTYFEIFPSEKHGDDFRILDEDSINTDAAAGLKASGQFDAERLAETVRVVKAYCGKLDSDYGVAADRLFVVASSGLLAGLGKPDDPKVAALIKKNQAALAEAVDKATGRSIDFITTDEEVEFQFRGSVPRKHAASALFLDIGGGGTRGGYREDVGLIRKVEAPGVRGFRDAVTKEVKGTATFEKAAAKLADSELRGPIRKQVKANEGLRAQDRVYLGGGIVWVMATTLKPDNRDTFCQLSDADIQAFYKAVRRGKYLDDYSVPAALPEEQAEWAKGELRRMRKNFSQEDLLAGSEILLALSAELNFAKKDLTFSRQSNNGWVLGYALDKLRGRK